MPYDRPQFNAADIIARVGGFLEYVGCDPDEAETIAAYLLIVAPLMIGAILAYAFDL